MKRLCTLLLALFSFSSFAGIHQAPPSFIVDGQKAVFVDFITATYELDYHHKSRGAFAKTTIYFKSSETGYPIFDSVTEPSEVQIDGKVVTHSLTSVPGNVSYVRLAKINVKPGFHTLVVKTEIQKGLRFGWKGVSSGFFIKDLKDRMFLERFVPTNYEYDQYSMIFKVRVNGTNKTHNIFANGEVKEISPNYIQVKYPKHYTSSSVFFHLVPKSRFYRLHFNYTSIDGSSFPVTIYSVYRFRNLRFKRKTIKVLKELERDYGAYPHPKLVVYGTKIRGGMEYVAATATSYVSLGHELQHSYFAKGILPADGNSGWMDEGIASWRDKGHQTHSRPDYFSFNLAKHNVYTRKTDKNSYAKGRSFMAYLDYQLKQFGLPGMQNFLRHYFQKRKFTTVTTDDFKSDLEEYSNMDFTDDFNQYIYGGHPDKKSKENSRSPAVEPENPHHPTYSEAEMNSII